MWWSDNPKRDWKKVEPYIVAAAQRLKQGFSGSDILEMILEKDVHLIVGEKSAMVVEGIQTPRLRILHIWVAGGDLNELTAAEKQFSSEWKKIGFDRISITGRSGWKRVLPSYEETAILLSKEL